MITTTCHGRGRNRPQVPAAHGVGWYRTRDVDEVAILRALDGDHLKLTKAERDAAIDLLDQKGLSAADIARRIGCAERTVTRRRTRRQAAGGPPAAISRFVQHTPEMWAQIANLDAAGYGATRIAVRLGIGRQTVYNHRRRRVEAGRVAA